MVDPFVSSCLELVGTLCQPTELMNLFSLGIYKLNGNVLDKDNFIESRHGAGKSERRPVKVKPDIEKIRNMMFQDRVMKKVCDSGDIHF